MAQPKIPLHRVILACVKGGNFGMFCVEFRKERDQTRKWRGPEKEGKENIVFLCDFCFAFTLRKSISLLNQKADDEAEDFDGGFLISRKRNCPLRASLNVRNQMSRLRGLHQSMEKIPLQHKTALLEATQYKKGNDQKSQTTGVVRCWRLITLTLAWIKTCCSFIYWLSSRNTMFCVSGITNW